MIHNIGFILLAIFLILTGLQLIAAVAVPGIITGLIALISGIFILLGR